MERVHGLRGAVPPLDVVAGDLLVGGGREAVDCVGAQCPAKMLDLAWGELPIRVGESGEVVGPNVVSAADVTGVDRDVVRVGEEE